MSLPEPSFTVGLEEEYLLINKETRDLANDPPKEFMRSCETALGSMVTPEFLRCQVEVGTPVCQTMQEAREQLANLRGTIVEIANKFDLAPLAVSTHPFATWRSQTHTDKERYNTLANDLQVVVRRMLICGMHVHVAIESDELRNDLMGQLSYFLPHLLALSTSSPFWEGQKSGLKSYRLSVFDDLPRTGLPEKFDSFDEYRRTVDVLVKAKLIEDTSKIWWDLRPSERFPTLESRITDVCPLLDDTIAIASLFRCLARTLYRLRRNNQRWRQYPLFLIRENRWRAQRYGTNEGLMDFGLGEIVDFEQLVEELIIIVAEDAAYFNCENEVARAREIVKSGTGADRQLATYDEAIKTGKSSEDALIDVVDLIAKETRTV